MVFIHPCLVHEQVLKCTILILEDINTIVILDVILDVVAANVSFQNNILTETLDCDV